MRCARQLVSRGTPVCCGQILGGAPPPLDPVVGRQHGGETHEQNVVGGVPRSGQDAPPVSRLVQGKVALLVAVG